MNLFYFIRKTKLKETFFSGFCLLAAGFFMFAAGFNALQPYTKLAKDPLSAEPVISVARIVVPAVLSFTFLITGYIIRARNIKSRD